jgi:FecR protein
MQRFTLAVVSALFLGEALAAAARVDFTYGQVSLIGPDGREQPLVRGAELDNGHTVRTAEGRAQLRFSDGAYVSLQPHSEFAIRDYRFEGKTDGAERGFFGLAKGAMRTVTGLVGRVNRDRYQVTTPTATIGIRGTGGVIQVLNDGSTLVVGTSGIWSLTNPAGSIDVPAGVSGHAPSLPDAPPRETSQAPQAGPPPLPQDAPFTQGEEVTETGLPTGLPGVPGTTPGGRLASGPGYATVLAYGLTDIALPQLVPGSNTTAQFNALGQLVQAELLPNIYKLDGAHADFGTDGILAWGRWIGQATVGIPVETYFPSQGLHYVVGMPTPQLPTQGTATYTLLGATRPTFTDGSAAPGTFSGDLAVNFGSLTVGLNLNVGIDGRSYALGGNAPITGSTFAGKTSSGQGPGTITASGCSSGGCSASVSGFFAGANAERAGLGYTISDDKRVVGAAAFTKQ